MNDVSKCTTIPVSKGEKRHMQLPFRIWIQESTLSRDSVILDKTDLSFGKLLSPSPETRRYLIRPPPTATGKSGFYSSLYSCISRCRNGVCLLTPIGFFKNLILNFSDPMEELEQWKEQAAHWWHLGLEYLRQVPPIQLYAAAAVLVLTTLLLLSSKSRHCYLSGLLLLLFMQVLM